jgi:hypothetical protein
MANWTTDTTGVTTDSFVSVVCDDGRTGRIAIRQESPGIVKFFGGVYETEVLIQDGFPVSGDEITIDRFPIIDGKQVR